MSQWPVDEIPARLDAPVPGIDLETTRRVLMEAGYGTTLADFLAPLYATADGGTYFDGALRMIPFAGVPEHDLPGLVEWNAEETWKQYAPRSAQRAFFFCSNAFGDLFGVPLTADGEIARDVVAALWVERYVYEEATLPWPRLLRKVLADEDSMGTYVARLKEYAWAAGALGRPTAWESFSWNLPPILGGSEGIDNLQIVPLVVNVSFTLQVIMESKQQDA